MRLHNIYIYYADISHNERKWRCCYIVCADKMPHAMRWPMSFYTTTQLLFLFFNFHSNFHPVSLFPAVNWERYIFLSAVCISRPGRCVLEWSVCVCCGAFRPGDWLAFIQRRAERSQWQSSGTSRRDALLLFNIGRADRGEHKRHFSYRHDPAIQSKMPIQSPI